MIKKINSIIAFMIFVNIFCFLIVSPAKCKFYVIKDKNGNIISFTSQNQISSQDKVAGYTITEKFTNSENENDPYTEKYANSENDPYTEKYANSENDPYGFNNIDWKKMTLKAKAIEEAISVKKEKNLPYPEFSIIATAYTPHERCCYPYADGFTSTHYKAGYKSVAIDPEYGMFFYGDVLYIEGYGIGLANDCGSAIKGKRIDVCFDLGDEKKAMDWGRKKVRVWVLKRGKE